MKEGTEIEIIDSNNNTIKGRWMRTIAKGIIIQQTDNMYLMVEWDNYNKGKRYRNIKRVKTIQEDKKI